jgi:hypothetical protein
MRTHRTTVPTYAGRAADAGGTTRTAPQEAP